MVLLPGCGCCGGGCASIVPADSIEIDVSLTGSLSFTYSGDMPLSPGPGSQLYSVRTATASAGGGTYSLSKYLGSPTYYTFSNNDVQIELRCTTQQWELFVLRKCFFSYLGGVDEVQRLPNSFYRNIFGGYLHLSYNSLSRVSTYINGDPAQFQRGVNVDKNLSLHTFAQFGMWGHRGVTSTMETNGADCTFPWTFSVNSVICLAGTRDQTGTPSSSGTEVSGPNQGGFPAKYFMSPLGFSVTGGRAITGSTVTDIFPVGPLASPCSFTIASEF